MILAGFSLGGYVAIEMLAHPERSLHGTALLSTSGRPESAAGAAVREKTISAIGRDFPRVVEGILQFATNTVNYADAALIDGMRRMMLDVGPETAIRQNRAIAARSDHREALRTLSLPALILCGRDDRVIPPPLSEELAGLMPVSKIHWVERAGHMLPQEQPRAVATASHQLIASANRIN